MAMGNTQVIKTGSIKVKIRYGRNVKTIIERCIFLMDEFSFER
jgi:hypothetical protein